jgi:hypothetical protein
MPGLHSELQYNDLFDKVYGKEASNCQEFLDWPGRTAPFSYEFFNSLRTSPVQQVDPTEYDWLNNLRGQVKITLFRDELVHANEAIQHLADTTMVFVMTSKELTKASTGDNGSKVIVDALWLSFTSFCAQSLFATFPSERSPENDNTRINVAMHFGLRALLFQEILGGKEIDKDKYASIWQTWPTGFDVDSAQMIFLWTALGRFIVAHEMSHLLLHAPGQCELTKAMERGVIPASWILIT